MKLLPYEKFTITTQASEKEAIAKIKGITEPIRSSRFTGPREKPYQGTINGNSFEISRIIHYRNAFLPIIQGDIRTEQERTVIFISMHLHIIVIAILLLLLGDVVIFIHKSFIEAITIFMDTGQFSISINFPPITSFLLLFGYLITTAGFKSEANNSKDFFHRLFE